MDTRAARKQTLARALYSRLDPAIIEALINKPEYPFYLAKT